MIDEIKSSGKFFYLLCNKDSWHIWNFPFDNQKLRLSLENSQLDSKSLVFVPDTVGKNYDPRFTLSGWTINRCDLSIGVKKYETTFRDPTLTIPHS